MTPAVLARPYVSLFASRFQLVLQYRGAAIAGFATQSWWGGLKVMILAAFYGAAASSAPIPLADAIAYTWAAQGLLALQPWSGDPDVAAAVRSGAVSYDRLRPLDFYAAWFARSTGWIAARVLPRFLLMFVFAAIVLPLVGLGYWGWHLPSSPTAALLFAVSAALALLLSASMVMLINVGVAALLDPRGINALIGAPAIVLTGNLLPLSLFPDFLQGILLVQPLAGVMDIPLRIYFQQLTGPAALGGLALQLFWLIALVLLGRWWIARVLHNLEMQGG